MEARLRATVVRWLLLAVVAFGVVVMHHVVADAMSCPDAHPTASTTAAAPMDQHPAPDPGPGHDVLHRCVAVIQYGLAVLVLLLLAGVAAVVSVTRLTFWTAPPRPPARPPPRPAGRALLHSVCVARL